MVKWAVGQSANRPTAETNERDKLYALETALARSKTNQFCDSDKVSNGRVQGDALLSAAGSQEEDCGCEIQASECVAI